MTADWLAENIVEIFGAVTGIAYVILEIRRNIWLWPLGIITSAVYIYIFGREGFYANMGLQWYYLVISIYGWYKWRAAIASNKEEARRASGIVEPGSIISHEISEARRASGIVEPGSIISYEISEARRASGIAEPGSTISHEIAEARRASGIVEPLDTQVTLPPPNPENIDGALRTDLRRIDKFTAVWCIFAAAVLWVVLWFALDRATDSPVPLWDGLIASLSVVATWMLTRKYLEQWYVWIFANAIAAAVYFASGLYPTAMLFMVYFVMAIVGVHEWRKEL